VNGDIFALGVLSVLLVGSNAFWAKIFFSLSNRLMSRSYYDFVQTEKLKAPTKRAEKPTEEMVIDPIDEQQAQSLNSMFGMV
jgi:hypothetical protein